MKKFIKIQTGVLFLIMCLIILSVITSCNKNDHKFIPNIVFGDTSISIPNIGGSQQIIFVTNSSWKATTGDDWITIINSSGEKGKDTVRVNIKPNNDDKRNGKVNISSSDGSFNKEITVIQESGKSTNFFVKNGKSGEGHSWEDATSLSSAMQEAASGDTIFVAAGTYSPTETIRNGDEQDNKDKTFEVSKNISIIGGYPSNASLGAIYDPISNETIFSGDLGNGDKAYHVMVITAPVVEDQHVTVKGLTVTDGYLGSNSSRFDIDGVTYSRGNGGGLNIGGSVVEFTDVNIVDNSGVSGSIAPGAFVGRGAEATFKNCKFNDNEGNGNGGALYVDRSNAYLYNSEVTGNSTHGTGPGIQAYPDAKVFLYNCSISNNSNTSFGAGVYLRQNSEGTLVNCLITQNTSTSVNGGGGLMMYNNCQATLISSTITDNDISGPGGGIFRQNGNNKFSVYNSIVSGNKSKDNGPDIDTKSGETQDAPILKSTISGSKAYDENGNEIAGAAFDAGSMLNVQYIPVGSGNPALTKGMSIQDLSGIGSSIYPPIDDDEVKVDINGKSRSGKNIMGAVLP